MDFRNFHKNRKLPFAISQTTQSRFEPILQLCMKIQGFIVLYFFIPGWVLLLMSFTYKESDSKTISYGDIDVGDGFGILSTWTKPSPTAHKCHQHISSPTFITNIDINWITACNFTGQSSSIGHWWSIQRHKKSFNMSWAGYKHYFIVDTESHRTSANRKESSNRRWMSS